MGGKRKREQKATNESEDETVEEKDEENAENKGSAFNPNRIFIGQLTYNTTEDQIKEHFKAQGVHILNLRLLTDKKTGKSRGMAFAELQSTKQIAVALRAHHSRLNGRQINVERSVGGGGKGEKRKEKLAKLKASQGRRTRQEIIVLIKQSISESEKTEMKFEDFDERVIEAFGTFPRDVATTIIKECIDIDYTNIESKSKYLMGVLKKYRKRLKAGQDLIEGSKDSEEVFKRQKKI